MLPRPWPFVRPFSVDDYPGVLVPLEAAHLYSYTARCGRSEYVDADDNGAESAGMLAGEYTLAGLRRAVRGDVRQWTDYELKSRLINKAIEDIGMGRYNWELFLLCGFGWFADNLWMQGVSLILPALSAEFGLAEKTVRYTTSALFLGLCLGSFGWGLGADAVGRRPAFYTTLLITSVCGTAAAYTTSWAAVCVLVAALGVGVGGNLPVDGALFLEFLPDSCSALLTLLSVWWPVGQLCASLLAWHQIGHGPDDGRGWRAFVATLGTATFVMFVLRVFCFRLLESPKFLLSQRREAEAVAVVHGLAWRNGTKTWLTAALLDAVAAHDGRHKGASEAAGALVGPAIDPEVGGAPGSVVPRPAASVLAVLRARLAGFSGERLRPLFRSRQLGRATATVWFIWATIGLGYPLFNAFLPQYLSHAAGTTPSAAPAVVADRRSTAYRNVALTSVAGVPGSLLAAYTVGRPSVWLGRRGTLALSTLVSAVFLFVFVAFGRSARQQLVFSCVEAFAQNIMYGVLYAFTPEMFPAPVRGTGTGVASFLNRVTGLVAPVVAATLPGDGATGPIYLSAVLILLAFFGMLLIPIETRGRQRL